MGPSVGGARTRTSSWQLMLSGGLLGIVREGGRSGGLHRSRDYPRESDRRFRSATMQRARSNRPEREQGRVFVARADIRGISPFFIVRDVPASLAFYRYQLGFEITFEGPEPDDVFFG